MRAARRSRARKLLLLALLAAGLLGALLRARGLLRALLATGLGGLGLLRRCLRSLLALAAADLTLLAGDVTITVEVVEVLAVIHLDAGRSDLGGLALRLARLLPGRGPDVAVLDVVHHVVVTLDSELRDLLTHGLEPSLGIIGCCERYTNRLTNTPENLVEDRFFFDFSRRRSGSRP